MAGGTESIEEAVLACGDLINTRGLGGLDGMHVYVHGLAPVQHLWTADVRRDVFSVSKTFVSIAIGMAEAEGLLSLGDRLIDHLGRLTPAAAPGIDSVTIEQLLTMTSGIVYRWDDDEIARADDPAAVVLSAPLGFAPGTGFAYRGSSSYLLSRIIQASAGQDLRDFLVPRLFSPLGIATPDWLRCPLGFSIGALGLTLRTEEVARVGRVLLDGGRWNGRQVVPPAFVAQLTASPVATDGHLATNADAPHPENARYGRHVWLCARDNAWRMDGLYGQFCIIFPDQRACVTVTAHYEGETASILDALWTEVVPLLS